MISDIILLNSNIHLNIHNYASNWSQKLKQTRNTRYAEKSCTTKYAISICNCAFANMLVHITLSIFFPTLSVVEIIYFHQLLNHDKKVLLSIN